MELLCYKSFTAVILELVFIQYT